MMDQVKGRTHWGLDPKHQISLPLKEDGPAEGAWSGILPGACATGAPMVAQVI